MKKETEAFLREETGTAIVIALIMMVVLTLIGLASTYTSTFEMKLSGNKRGSTEAFYTADAGPQCIQADITNFYVSNTSNYKSPNPIPLDLQNESIDKKYASPSLSLPAGVSFVAPPQVTIYHTTRTSAPRGMGFSAAGNFGFEHFIVDSTGKDQTDVGLTRSTVQIREKFVRLIPTLQGGY